MNILNKVVYIRTYLPISKLGEIYRGNSEENIL